MNTLSFFPNSCARNSKDPLAALLEGAKSSGIKVYENNLDADVAVIWSVLWHGRMMANKDIYHHYRKRNKPVLVMDVGALYRGATWKVAVNNINAEGYYGHQTDLDWDRPKKLNLSLAHRVGSNGKILIATQHRDSLQVHDMGSMEAWVQHNIDQVRSLCDKTIVVRNHPRSRLDYSQITGAEIEIPKKLSGTYDSFDMHLDFDAVINYNSGPGIQAAISDCPVVTDKTSLAHPVSIALGDIVDPPQQDRDRWFVEICHTEYTLDELKKGIWLKRLNGKI